MRTKSEVIEYIKKQQLTETLAEEIYSEVFEVESLNSTTGITEKQLDNLNELIESFTGVPVNSKPMLSGVLPIDKPEPEKLEVFDKVDKQANQQTELETAARGSLRGVQLMELYQDFTIKGMVAQTPYVEQNIKNAFELLTSPQLQNVKELSEDSSLINKIVKLAVNPNVVEPPTELKEVNKPDVIDLVNQQVDLNSKKVNKENFLKNFKSK